MPFRGFLPSKYVFEWGKLCGNFTILKQVDCGEDIKSTVKIFFSAQFLCWSFVSRCQTIYLISFFGSNYFVLCKKIKICFMLKKHWKNFQRQTYEFPRAISLFSKKHFFPFPSANWMFSKDILFLVILQPAARVILYLWDDDQKTTYLTSIEQLQQHGLIFFLYIELYLIGK